VRDQTGKGTEKIESGWFWTVEIDEINVSRNAVDEVTLFFCDD
jgi:hypothetical protein